VLTGHAPDALLDSYEEERITFARRLVNTTDKVFTLATAEGRIADILRTRIAPVVIPALARFETVRGFLFRTVSQVTINYRRCELNAGAAGDVHGGDRLPWVVADGIDNYASLGAMEWQVHVYGAVRPDLADWCEAHDVPLTVFAWRQKHEHVGLTRNALYLLRPDSYIGLADPSCAVEALEHYFDERSIRVGLPHQQTGRPVHPAAGEHARAASR
jgi:hypothetical protein